MSGAPRNTILIGDALDQLRQLPDSYVNCVTTSIPFYLQRDYQVSGQIGLESTVDEWVERLMPIMNELRRVITAGGSIWVDTGDTFSRHSKFGAPTKSLFMAGERLALRYLETGMILRSKVVWWKISPMPDGVQDRMSTTYDVVYHFVKSPKYFFDLDSVRVPEPDGQYVGRNPGDVWRLPTANFRGAHFATFPEALVERPLLTTCPLRVCVLCGTPWNREPSRIVTIGKRVPPGNDPKIRRYRGSWRTLRQPGEIKPGCTCDGPSRPGLVLDPFFGTGTVAQVALRHGRDWLGIELNPTYVALARQRLGQHAPPLKEAA